MPSSKDLTTLGHESLALAGPGLKGKLTFKTEKTEYLFSVTINKSKQSRKYKLMLNESCSKGRSLASLEGAFEIGTFKGISQELLTEFFVNRYQVEEPAGTLKYKYFQVVEDPGGKKGSQKAVQVACVQIGE